MASFTASSGQIITGAVVSGSELGIALSGGIVSSAFVVNGG